MTSLVAAVVELEPAASLLIEVEASVDVELLPVAPDTRM